MADTDPFLATNTDLGTLKFENDYRSYFDTLQAALRRYADVYEAARPIGEPGEPSFEARAFSELAERLLATIAVLRLRYLYREADDRALYVDLSDSGFPNFQEISRMESDIGEAASKLGQMPAMPALRRKLIDRIIETGDANPQEALAAIGSRAYYESLADPTKLFLTFTEGSLKYLGETDRHRHYAYACGAYDPTANLPILYVLLFDQDVEEPPMEEDGPHRTAFRERMRAEASHTSPLGVMAMGIDNLPCVSPKMLKRLTIGPLFAPFIFDARDAGSLSDREELISALCTAVEGEEVFLLCGSDEIVTSAREERASSSIFTAFSTQKRVRQIFYLPEDDLELYRRKASVMHRYALLPHGMIQELTPAVRAKIPELCPNAILIPFTQQGETNVIGQRSTERTSD
jgi:hypothetical protein